MSSPPKPRSASSGQKPPVDDRTFVRRLLLALVVVGIAIFLWNMRGLLLLIFGAVLIAVLLHALADPIRRHSRLPQPLALLAAVLLVATVIALTIWSFGSEVAGQAAALQEMIPRAWEVVQRRLDAAGFGDTVREWTEQARSGLTGSGVLTGVGGVLLSVGAGLTDLLLVLLGGIYLAAQPGLYRRGLLKLLPSASHERAERALDRSGRSLKLWLLGQLVSMLLVGTVIGLGLWLIGMPSALTLGLLAGLLTFVPLIGPILAAIPALLLAFVQGTEMMIYTLILYFVVQQIEGSIIQPIVQQRAVDLPPAILLFSLLAAGLTFGTLGIILAAPLTVVLYVLVKQLYVADVLGHDTDLQARS